MVVKTGTVPKEGVARLVAVSNLMDLDRAGREVHKEDVPGLIPGFDPRIADSIIGRGKCGRVKPRPSLAENDGDWN